MAAKRNLADPHTKHPPKDAAERITEYAADGFSREGIATKLGVGRETFRTWLKEDAAL